MAARKPTAKKTAPKKTAPQNGKPGGADAAVESYFAQQAPEKRVLLTKLRALVEKGAPDAVPSIKWGVPIYMRNGRNICALRSKPSGFWSSPLALIVYVDCGPKSCPVGWFAFQFCSA